MKEKVDGNGTLPDSKLREISDNLGLPLDTDVVALEYMIKNDLTSYAVGSDDKGDRLEHFKTSAIIAGQTEYRGYIFLISNEDSVCVTEMHDITVGACAVKLPKKANFLRITPVDNESEPDRLSAQSLTFLSLVSYRELDRWNDMYWGDFKCALGDILELVRCRMLKLNKSLTCEITQRGKNYIASITKD